MIKIIKSNKFAILLTLFLCFIIALSPQTYAKSCLNALSVWTIKIFPTLFPFFVFTRIIVNLSENKPNFMDKFFNKIYNTPNGSFKTFFLSALSGYPMGAKLISVQYEKNQINSNQAKSMLSFCSVSGPMFMLGTVGIGILCSYKAGLIILISNLFAALFNGLLYRSKTIEKQENYTQKIKTKFNLGDQVSDSLNSILMVGAYIVLSFLIIDILKNLNILSFISNSICCVFRLEQGQDVVNSVLCGLLEITRGIIELNCCNISIVVKTIITSFLIGFGGFSIFYQSTHFIEKLNLKKSSILLQKITQAVLSLIISLPLSFIFL